MPHPAPIDTAPQHGPRPLPLFLELLRSETAASPERFAAAMAGLKAYQDAPRFPREGELPVVESAGRARLLDYGGAGRPVLFVPSLINPPFVLDLAPHNSMLRWLAAQGANPLLLDWGTPATDEAALDIAGHVETLLLPLIDALDEPPVLAGYCLGGTMALAAAALRAPPGLALIATPWHFSGFGDAARADMVALWNSARSLCETLGYVPMEVLQSGFWRLDPGRTISKFERFSTLDPDSDAARDFVALEDWANGGAPLTLAAGRDSFERLFGANDTGAGRWSVGGKAITPDLVTCPTIDIVSLNDRIVPAASASGLPNRVDLGAGHVGMVVGSRAKAQLWEPLAAWLSQLQQS